ncbi:MAG: RluA family pseudouridine synthase [Eubacterium sp.]|nr:RluA family pseudouridine synthase [Eubacterium sp.]
MREISFKIDKSYDEKKIRDYLRDFGVSTSLLQQLKNTENGVTVNGEFKKTIDILHTDDILTIRIENRGKMTRPAKMDIDVVYEDEDIIVFNKPPHLPVHESHTHIGDTLSNFAAYHLGENGAFRAVYRLDNDTSGLVLVGKNKLASSKLARNIKKDYYAVVSGIIEGNGTVDKPIARCGDSIIKREVNENGESAVTHYEAVSHKDGTSFIKLNLETGRTHQIRVHMSHLGYPLLGDTLYGGNTDKISRQALHCKDIYFTHPVTGEEMHLSCDFPKDIKELI